MPLRVYGALRALPAIGGNFPIVTKKLSLGKFRAKVCQANLSHEHYAAIGVSPRSRRASSSGTTS
jgi:hypothetical protein